MLVALGDLLTGTDDELSTAAAMFHSPLNYPAVVPKDRRLIIAGLGDRLAPPEQAEVAVGALGPLRVPLVPRQSHPACQPAGLPAQDDALHARLHVQLGRSSLSGADQRNAGEHRAGLGVRRRYGPVDLPAVVGQVDCGALPSVLGEPVDCGRVLLVVDQREELGAVPGLPLSLACLFK